MAIRIEIAKINKLLEIRIGDLEGCSTSSNLTMEEVIEEIKEEISKMLTNESIGENGVINFDNIIESIKSKPISERKNWEHGFLIRNIHGGNFKRYINSNIGEQNE